MILSTTRISKISHTLNLSSLCAQNQFSQYIKNPQFSPPRTQISQIASSRIEYCSISNQNSYNQSFC
ncbi:hypothetical protein Syun_023115 [Stephania yunnanensis]|uniref:Uncharacterized protein n=1 Tax=Stephania yunnanensis TaxID=152371 RepID=A0AAP0F905_9MAGN